MYVAFIRINKYNTHFDLTVIFYFVFSGVEIVAINFTSIAFSY